MKTRVISAIVALAIVIPLFIIGKIPFAVGVALLAAQALKETVNLKESHHPYPGPIFFIGLMAVIALVIFRRDYTYIVNGIPLLIVAISFLLLLIPAIFDTKEKYNTRDAFYLIGTILYIGVFFNLLIALREYNWRVLLYLLLISTMTDIFAYFVGSLIGKHKILPKVSPKKSVEGCIGGSILGTAIATIYFVNVVPSNIPLAGLIAITFVLTVLGQLGDFFFSKIKRENNIKDFSNIMPGHGGVLDRLDSITFITYGFVFLMILFKLYV